MATKKAASKRLAQTKSKGNFTRSAEIELDEFLAKFTPEVEDTARQALKKMRARLPGAIELVYDNYNALAIGFSSYRARLGCDFLDCSFSALGEFVLSDQRHEASRSGMLSSGQRKPGAAYCA